jgi:hypothetical protein
MTPDRANAGEPGKLEGKYTNYFAIGHSQCEFVIDFGQSYSEDESPEFYTRIVTGPVYAKALLEMLRDAIETYEITFGSIACEDCETTGR